MTSPPPGSRTAGDTPAGPEITDAGNTDAGNAAASPARAAPGSTNRRLRLAMLAVGLVGFAAAALGIGVRAIDAAHAAVDEPQYLLTALSLGDARDLDHADEAADQRWRAARRRRGRAGRPVGGGCARATRCCRCWSRARWPLAAG